AALGSTAEVTSPTFTIAQFYTIPSGTFLHIDAYRLSSVAEFRDLALDDFVADSITAVEWGDIVEEDFPNALSINFEFVENEDNWRKLTFSAATEQWQAVLSSLKNQSGERLKVWACCWLSNRRRMNIALCLDVTAMRSSIRL